MLFSYGMVKTVAPPKPFFLSFSRDLAEIFQSKWFKSQLLRINFFSQSRQFSVLEWFLQFF
jgi:hypothetical protein